MIYNCKSVRCFCSNSFSALTAFERRKCFTGVISACVSLMQQTMEQRTALGGVCAYTIHIRSESKVLGKECPCQIDVKVSCRESLKVYIQWTVFFSSVVLTITRFTVVRWKHCLCACLYLWLCVCRCSYPVVHVCENVPLIAGYLSYRYPNAYLSSYVNLLHMRQGGFKTWSPLLHELFIISRCYQSRATGLCLIVWCNKL